MKVLAIDDDPVALTMLEGALRSLQYDVVTATSGADALELGLQRDFHLIVSDWNLPELDGLDLCRRVRQRRTDYVCFILVTQEAPTDANLEQAITAGVDDFLTKPVKLRDLKLRLHGAERTLRLTQEVQQLESLIPMCSYCRKVRNDRDYWQSIEAFLDHRGVGRVSHGVCPECYRSVVVPYYRELGIELPETPEGAKPGPDSA